MPYYVFAIRPFAQLEKLGEHAAFKDASAQAKALRAAQARHAGAAAGSASGAAPATRIKVMFADNQLSAEDQLLQGRDPAPQPEDE
jgi:hypothetical protein